MIDPLICGLVAALFGACVGSFLNVVIYRVPMGLSVNEPKRSFCPLCKSSIQWYDNLPIVSWLILGAKCRSCKKTIPWRYPFVEFLTAVFFFLAFYECLPVDPQAYDLVRSGFWAVLFAVLIAISYIDFDHRLILDEINVSFAVIVPWVAFALPGIPIDTEHLGLVTDLLKSIAPSQQSTASAVAIDPGAAIAGSTLILCSVAAIVGALLSAWVFRATSPHPDPEDPRRRTMWEARWALSLGGATSLLLAGLFLSENWLARLESQALLASLVGTLAGAGILQTIGVVGSWVFRKQAMGFGDVKFLALLGGLLGWQAVGFSLFIACLLGSVIGIGAKLFTKDSYIPFGPFLAGGAVAMILWGDWVQRGLDLYLQLFRH